MSRRTPTARRRWRAAWRCAVLISAGLALLDVGSRFRHIAYRYRGSFAISLSLGAVWVVVTDGATTRVSRPPEGLTVSSVPFGYAIGSTGPSTLDEPFPGIQRARRPSGGTSWIMGRASLWWWWVPLMVLGIAGLFVTRRPGPGFCSSCGYPLAGLPPGADRCPECGKSAAPASDSSAAG